MALKGTLAKEEFASLPDPVRDLYVEKNGAYILEVEGLVDAKALDSERGLSAKAKRELQQLREKLGDLDVDAAREAIEERRKMADKQMLDEGKVEELFKSRTEQLQKAHQNQVKAYEDRIAEAEETLKRTNSALRELRIKSEITPLALKKGARASAIPDIISRVTALGVNGIRWDIEGDQVIAKKGEQIAYGRDASRPMSFEEGLELLSAEAPHLFEPSNGAGAQRGAQQAGGFVLSADDAKDPSKYRAAKEAATKAGQELQIAR